MGRARAVSERFTQCMKNLGAMVSKYREEKGETKAAFARGCGVSTSLIGRIEEGNANPRISTLGKIADHMEIPVVELLRQIGMLDLGETKNRS